MRTRYIGRGAKIGCATASPGSSALPTTTAPIKTERKNVGVFIAQNCNSAPADVEAEARTLGKPAEKTGPALAAATEAGSLCTHVTTEPPPSKPLRRFCISDGH